MPSWGGCTGSEPCVGTSVSIAAGFNAFGNADLSAGWYCNGIQCPGPADLFHTSICNSSDACAVFVYLSTFVVSQLCSHG